MLISFFQKNKQKKMENRSLLTPPTHLNGKLHYSFLTLPLVKPLWQKNTSFCGSLPASNILFVGTPPAKNILFSKTLPASNILFAGTHLSVKCLKNMCFQTFDRQTAGKWKIQSIGQMSVLSIMDRTFDLSVRCLSGRWGYTRHNYTMLNDEFTL